MTDEIIKELRAVKDAIGAECDYDVARLAASLRATERQLRGAGVKFEDAPQLMANAPDESLRRTRSARR